MKIVFDGDIACISLICRVFVTKKRQCTYAVRGSGLRMSMAIIPKGLEGENTCSGCFQFSCELLSVQLSQGSTVS